MRCAMASERKALQRRRAILLRRSTTRPQRTQGLHPLVLQAHALQLHAGGDGRKLDQVHPVCSKELHHTALDPLLALMPPHPDPLAQQSSASWQRNIIRNRSIAALR